MNILIVEDHEELRKMLVLEVERRLTRNGSFAPACGGVVYEASTLGLALDALAFRRVDAILCDGEFPIGWATLSFTSLSQSEAWLAVAYRAALEGKRFALFSGDLETVDKARAIGIVGAFLKPDGLRDALDFLMHVGAHGRAPLQTTPGPLADATGIP